MRAGKSVINYAAAGSFADDAAAAPRRTTKQLLKKLTK